MTHNFPHFRTHQLEEKVRHESQAMHLLFAQWHKVMLCLRAWPAMPWVPTRTATARWWLHRSDVMPRTCRTICALLRSVLAIPGLPCVAVARALSLAHSLISPALSRPLWQDYFLGKTAEERELEAYFLG